MRSGKLKSSISIALATIAASAILIMLSAPVTQAVVIPANTTDADFVAAGEAASSAGLFGSIETDHQSGAVGHSSVTMLTTLMGARLPIGTVPASSGVTLTLGGFGQHATESQSLQPQDGKPRSGTAPFFPAPIFANPAYFDAAVFDPNTFGNDNVYAAPGDSGGRVGTSDGR